MWCSLLHQNSHTITNAYSAALSPSLISGFLHAYEVRPRKDDRGFDLVSDALPFGRLCYGEANAVSNAIGYAKHRSRSHNAVIRVYDEGAT